MDKQDGKVPVFPWQRGEILTKLNRVTNLQKLKAAHKSICRMIEEREESMKTWGRPRNPREDVIQVHDKKTLEVWKRQKNRQETQMAQLEEEIRRDIEASKAE